MSIAVPHVMAAKIFVASYSGTISTLEFSSKNNSSTGYSLDLIAQSKEVGPTPSWLTLDRKRNFLYCTEPGVSSAHGTLNSLAIGDNGTLTLDNSISTPTGAAYAGTYGRDDAIGVAF
jgi:6-phosphogluconolactonase (cycloisomerase 2 family)